jgi:hypothetical protein
MKPWVRRRRFDEHFLVNPGEHFAVKTFDVRCLW